MTDLEWFIDDNEICFHWKNESHHFMMTIPTTKIALSAFPLGKSPNEGKFISAYTDSAEETLEKINSFMEAL
jgi:pyoverdine/dityrosine biosynthesis protein Dit1